MEPQDKNKPPFEVGDLVTTNYYKGDPLRPSNDPEELNVARKVLAVRWNGSWPKPSWGVQADGGESCPHCGRVGRPIMGLTGSYWGVNAEWFKLVERRGPNG